MLWLLWLRVDLTSILSTARNTFTVYKTALRTFSRKKRSAYQRSLKGETSGTPNRHGWLWPSSICQSQSWSSNLNWGKSWIRQLSQMFQPTKEQSWIWLRWPNLVSRNRRMENRLPSARLVRLSACQRWHDREKEVQRTLNQWVSYYFSISKRRDVQV